MSFGHVIVTLKNQINFTQKIKILKIPGINTSYKMWINGKLLAENGITGKDKIQQDQLNVSLKNLLGTPKLVTITSFFALVAAT